MKTEVKPKIIKKNRPRKAPIAVFLNRKPIGVVLILICILYLGSSPALAGESKEKTETSEEGDGIGLISFNDISESAGTVTVADTLSPPFPSLSGTSLGTTASTFTVLTSSAATSVSAAVTPATADVSKLIWQDHLGAGGLASLSMTTKYTDVTRSQIAAGANLLKVEGSGGAFYQIRMAAGGSDAYEFAIGDNVAEIASIAVSLAALATPFSGDINVTIPLKHLPNGAKRFFVKVEADTGSGYSVVGISFFDKSNAVFNAYRNDLLSSSTFTVTLYDGGIAALTTVGSTVEGLDPYFAGNPEPATMAIFGVGLFGLFFKRKFSFRH